MDLWLNENHDISNIYLDNSFYLKYCYPCARQCITQYLIQNNCLRNHYIAIPEYLSICVLNAINKISTTVPIIFLNKLNIKKIKIFFIYDQWGWERPPLEIKKFKDIYNGLIILDRVDTLINYKKNKKIDNVDVQIFSLNKTLGIGGGGLLFYNDYYVGYNNKYTNDISNNFINYKNYKNYDDLDHLFKNNFEEYTPLFINNINQYNIDYLIEYEFNYRYKLLKILMGNFSHLLPEWMLLQYNLKKSAPNIFPLCIKNLNYNTIEHIKQNFNIDIKILHFNFSENYFTFDWKKVLPIPLHSKIKINTIESLIIYIKETYILCNYAEL